MTGGVGFSGHCSSIQERLVNRLLLVHPGQLVNFSRTAVVIIPYTLLFLVTDSVRFESSRFTFIHTHHLCPRFFISMLHYDSYHPRVLLVLSFSHTSDLQPRLFYPIPVTVFHLSIHPYGTVSARLFCFINYSPVRSPPLCISLPSPTCTFLTVCLPLVPYCVCCIIALPSHGLTSL